jgi:uncharacterized protein with PQ loop repeat
MSSPYYYSILFAILLTTFGFISIFHHILQTKNVDSIPFISLFSFGLATLIFLFISLVRKYPAHLIFYILTLVAIIGILHLKRQTSKE